MTQHSAEKYDLIVIGGGSAGMAAAIHAAQNGLDVLVFDASGPDFDKPCGEGLMPPAISALKRLGVTLPESHRLTGIKYVTESGASAFGAFAKDSLALGVRRRLLRRAMWNRARELGVRIEETPADSVVVSQDGVHTNGFNGRYLCIATGAHSRVLRKVGIGDRKRAGKRPIRIGLRRHVNIAPWSEVVEVHWRDYCELYVTPVSEACVNIAILSWLPLSFDQAMDLFPEIKDRLQGASWDDLPAGRGPLYHRAARTQKGRVLVAGDAALFIDAMTGEGNTLAIRSGVAVSEAIIRGNPILYRWLWLKVVWRYWLLTAPVSWASQNLVLRRNLLKLIIRVPILLKWGVGFLSADSQQVLGDSHQRFSRSQDYISNQLRL